jgi:hypothetical protein
MLFKLLFKLLKLLFKFKLLDVHFESHLYFIAAVGPATTKTASVSLIDFKRSNNIGESVQICNCPKRADCGAFQGSCCHIFIVCRSPTSKSLSWN